MSDSESALSEHEFPLKTRKPEDPTRHPTTVKKNEHSPSPFHRTQPRLIHSEPHPSEPRRPKRSHSLRQSLWTLENEKQYCLQSGRYTQAKTLSSQINRTRSVLNRVELKQLSQNHKQEKKSILSAYQHELHYFQNAWSSYFKRFKDFQRTKLTHFKQQQNEEIEFIREKLRKKCNTLRQPSRQVMDLEKEEKYHLKHGNIAELMLVRKQKKKLVSNIKMERRELISKWTQMEGKQLERFQSTRYSVLMNRMEEQQKDQEESFIAENKRLKQKYKNVLGQLKHEQRMTTQFVTRHQTQSQA